MTQEALLKLLETDARLSDRQIADRLGVSVSEVAAERATLEQEGRIVGYQTIVNHDEQGVAAFIEVRCTPERGEGFDRLAQRIARFDEVKSCYLMSGGYDLLVLVEGKNLKELALFVSSKLSALEQVTGTQTCFVLKRYKEDGIVFEGEKADNRLVISP